MATRLEIDDSGRLVEDAFYGVATSMFIDEEWRDVANEWYLRDRIATVVTRESLKRDGDWISLTDLSPSNKLQEFCECALDPTHVTRRLYSEIRVDVDTGSEPSPILPTDDKWFISDEFQKQLKELKIIGSDVRLARINVNQSGHPDPALFAWQFTGKYIVRPPKFVDGENVCPVCQVRPLNCPECGGRPASHKKCEELILNNRRTGKQPDSFGFAYDSDYFDKNAVLEGRRWDGADLLYGPSTRFVTRRTYEWLIKVHAAPLAAWPVRVCVDGMSAEQLKWLDRARGEL